MSGDGEGHLDVAAGGVGVGAGMVGLLDQLAGAVGLGLGERDLALWEATGRSGAVTSDVGCGSALARCCRAWTPRRLRPRLSSSELG